MLLYGLAFVFGAAVGSFLNVCVYRIPRGLSVVSPRSACPVCGAHIKPLDLVPIAGYIILRGRCRACQMRIPIRYPAIELICGAAWAALLWRFSPSFQFVCYSALCSILLAIFFIDIEWMRIPNALVACAMMPAAALAVRYAFFMSGIERFRSVYNSVSPFVPLWGLAPCAFFFAVHIISAIISGGKGGIGMGDVKLLAPIGMALGLQQCAFAAVVSVMAGGLCGAALIIMGIKNRKDPIPFGPFIVAGTYAAIFIPVSNILAGL